MLDEVVKDIWHVYSDGTRADIPFDTDEDKLFAWNSIAVCAEIAGVQVWVSTVNDTHLHTLVKGVEVRVKRFRNVLLFRQAHAYGREQGIYKGKRPCLGKILTSHGAVPRTQTG